MLEVITPEEMLTRFKEVLRDGLAESNLKCRTADRMLALFTDSTSPIKNVSVYCNSFEVVSIVYDSDLYEWKYATIGKDYMTSKMQAYAEPFRAAYRDELKRRGYDVHKE
jgi:hypothetical protein